MPRGRNGSSKSTINNWKHVIPSIMLIITKVSFPSHTRKCSNFKIGYFAPKLTFSKFDISKEVLDLKKRLNEIYSKHTDKSVEDVKKALERDNFMTPEVAKDFGLIDEVVENRS